MRQDENLWWEKLCGNLAATITNSGLV